MLKALGLGKTPASQSEIKKHRELVAQRNQWRRDVDRLRTIILKLDNAYKTHKGDFALGRYEGLKDMIKAAIKEYESIVQESQTKALFGGRARQYGDGGGSGPPEGGASGSSTSGGKWGLISRLKLSASNFAESREVTSGRQEPCYSEMSNKDVEEDYNNVRRELMDLKQDYRKERDKLVQLAKEYEESKKYSPPQRYSALKLMIKNLTRSSTTWPGRSFSVD